MSNRSFFDFPVSRNICCPRTGSKLRRDGDRLVAVDGDPTLSYPIIDDIPVLFDAERSVFSPEEFVEETNASKELDQTPQRPRFKSRLAARLPAIGRNLRANENLAKFASLLLDTTTNPQVLVLGGGALGAGMKQLVDEPRIDVVESDVYLGDRTQILLDAHQIPFEDGTFDGLIIQGVLSLLHDPFGCASEIHRVLKKDGIVYAEAPFAQQVCVPFDFYRFTHLGLLRLFNRFSEIASGAQGGPGMALAWSYKYFLLSWTKSRRTWVATYALAHLTGWWPSLFDRFLIDRPAAMDAASGVFFLGRRSDATVSNLDIMKKYRGMMPG